MTASYGGTVVDVRPRMLGAKAPPQEAETEIVPGSAGARTGTTAVFRVLDQNDAESYENRLICTIDWSPESGRSPYRAEAVLSSDLTGFPTGIRFFQTRIIRRGVRRFNRLGVQLRACRTILPPSTRSGPAWRFLSGFRTRPFPETRQLPLPAHSSCGVLC